MENQYGDTLSERLYKRADEIGAAVSRNEDDLKNGDWCEIELLREAAKVIEELQETICDNEQDFPLLMALRQRRKLLDEIATSKAALAEVDKLLFPTSN